MKQLFSLIFVLHITNALSQTYQQVTPAIESEFSLGEQQYFEQDLEFIQRMRNNDMVTVNNYSFVPRMIYAHDNSVLIFDRFSRNMISYNSKTREKSNIDWLSEILKTNNDLRKQNIELVDVEQGNLLFYDLTKNESILANLKNKRVCRLRNKNPIALASSSTDTLTIYGYTNSVKTTDCKIHRSIKSKRLRINENNSFIKSQDFLFYQEMAGKRIRALDLSKTPLEETFISLTSNIDLTNFRLIHATKEFYVLTSTLENGIGRFLFFAKGSKTLFKAIEIKKEILNNDLIDLNDLSFNAPSPDVDDTSAYIRMTSINEKYFFIFQSKGVLHLYSFTI